MATSSTTSSRQQEKRKHYNMIAEQCRTCCKSKPTVRCGGCQDAVYCDQDCAKKDWKMAGHRELCQGPEENRMIRNILQDLFRSEYEWLKTLSDAELRMMANPQVARLPLRHECFRAGEVALVLARANPCAALWSYWCDYGIKYYTSVLKPWFTEHQYFLSEQGFHIDFFGHEVTVAATNNGHVYSTIKNFALIKDQKNPKITLVDKVFTVKRSKNMFEWDPSDIATVGELFTCLSYTFSGGHYQPKKYCFKFPEQLFGDDQAHITPCFLSKAAVGPNDAIFVGKHFRKCFDAMMHLDLPICLPGEGVINWMDHSIAMLWLAIAGGDPVTIDLFVKEEVIGQKLPTARVEHIILLAREQASPSTSL